MCVLNVLMLDKEADPRGFLMEQSKVAGRQWKRMNEDDKKVRNQHTTYQNLHNNGQSSSKL